MKRKLRALLGLEEKVNQPPRTFSFCLLVSSLLMNPGMADDRGRVRVSVAGGNTETMATLKEHVTRSGNKFALNLYLRVSEKANAENILLCPYGVNTSLGMAYAGAAGETAEEIARTLQFQLPPSDLAAALKLLNPAQDRRRFLWGIRAEDNNRYGVRIAEVRPQTPASLGRLRPNDLILSIDNSPIRCEEDLARAVDFSTGTIDVTAYNYATGVVMDHRVKLEATDSNPSPAKIQQIFSVANGLWNQDGLPLRTDFVETLLGSYGAHADSADFARNPSEAVQKINSWTAAQTNGKIGSLFDEANLGKDTKLLLTNGVYFEAAWDHVFDRTRTRAAEFRVSSEKSIRTQMMNQTDEFRYVQSKDCQCLELPYAESRFSMVIFLPQDITGLKALTESLTERYEAFIREMRPVQVSVSLPKFSLTGAYELQEQLAAMGMTSAFSGRANFSKMSDSGELMLSKVVHKVFVRVDEVGTKAGAATGTVAVPRLQPIEFRADRPFFFVIRDRVSEGIVFAGRIVQPEE